MATFYNAKYICDCDLLWLHSDCVIIIVIRFIYTVSQKQDT